MPRDFASERYVRMYTGDSPGWAALGWAGQCVWTLLYRQADRQGCVSLGSSEPWERAQVLCELPAEVARAGMAACLAEGWFVQRNGRLEIPRYVEANSTPKSGAQRVREHRERRAALQRNVTSLCNDPLPNVTVTLGNAEKQNVTALHAVPESGPDVAQLATRAAAWLSNITGLEPFPANKRWREALLWLAQRPDDQKAKAAGVLRGEAARGPEVARMLNPEHVQSYWHYYGIGRVPGGKVTSVAPRALTELEQLQAQYSELSKAERACLFDETPKRERLQAQMSQVSARMTALKGGHNGRS